MGAASNFLYFNQCLYTCVVQTAVPNWFCAAIALALHCAGISSLRRHSYGGVVPHQLYSFAKEVWFGTNRDLWWASLVKQGSNKILPKVSRLFNGPSAQPTEPGRRRAVGIRSLHPYRSRSLGQRTQTSRICQTTVECFQRLAGSTFSGGATPPSLQGPAGSARRPCRTRHSSWAKGTTRAGSRGPLTGSATAPTFGAGVRRGSQQESGTPLLCTNLEIELWNPSKDGSGMNCASGQ